MSDERPEALLKSALEKIIYFEARSEQLSTDLRGSRDESERLRRELAAAAQREIALRGQVAELEVTVARSTCEREEQARVNEALRRERKELIGKLLDASRLHATGEEVAGEPEFDLASFIAELRGEALGLREAQIAPIAVRGEAMGLRETPGRREAPAAEASGSPADRERAGLAPGHRVVEPVAVGAPALVAVRAPGASLAATMTRHAERFRAQGRLDVSSEELHALAREPLVEETLFGFSVRELSAPEPGARVRAAERLRSLATPAAAPALAAALNAEQEPRVLVALLEAFAPASGPEGAAVVTPHLRSSSADVRISALRALMRVDAAEAAPHLSAAMKDPDRTVRRRASLLALGLQGPEALALGEEAGRDPDPKVRALGALALGAAGGAQARAGLTGLLQDVDAAVRQAASKSLSRILGTDVSSVVTLDDAQRRREIRRLAAMPANPVTAAWENRPSAQAPLAGAAPPAREQMGAGAANEAAAVPPGTRVGAPAPAAIHDSTRVPADEALCAAVLAELRINIRGRAAPDLSRVLGAPAERVDEACALLCARGQAVRRGLKYFVA